MNLTEAMHARMVGDPTLVTMLALYKGEPAVFTTDPAPGDAVLPYIVSAGEAVNTPFDTKTTRGNRMWRDVRCYDHANGSVIRVEAIAERVRALFHRQSFLIPGFAWIWAECSGPIAADEQDAYGRIVSVRLTIEEV